MDDNKILFGIFGLFATVYGFVLKHLFGKVQFKDVCLEKVQRLEDCIEAEVKRNTERYEALEKKLDKFEKKLDSLIKLNGGTPDVRIRT